MSDGRCSLLTYAAATREGDDSMLITSLGHAGLRVETAELRLLMDPWLATTGAFQGAWHQFPSNAHLDTPRTLDCDWVTVSHEHLDHMDLSVLSRLPGRTRVLIPRYPSKNFLRRLRDAGIGNVIEVSAWQRFPLNTAGDWLTFIPEQSPMCHDAGVLVCAGGAALLHCNDARLSVGQGRRATVEAGGRLDVMAVQMSGASWHPICYEYPREVAERLETEKRVGKFKAVTRLLRGVAPRLAVPFAGPPCFLDPVIQDHNPSSQHPGIFPSLDQAAAWLAERLPGVPSMYWLPGDTYEVGPGRCVRDPRWEGFSFADTGEYLASYAAERQPALAAVYAAHPDPGDDLAERFAEHFARLGGLSPYFLERIDMTVRFEVEGPAGGCWDVRLGPDSARVSLHGGSGAAQYRFRVASRWLEPVIAGRLGWEDLLLSLRFSAWRSPDLYNDYLVGLLKHADADALEAVASYESSRDSGETVVVEGTDGRYEVGRYCPHAGEDLTHGAVVQDGVLRCLGHNFDFDLATGQCLNARCDPLSVRPAQAPVRS
jgi:L-ascorbate metabolism protein UlaG (beta-lactamase superfamily)/nitrite reductase/ring-hydroxylating ferredoxin subunit